MKEFFLSGRWITPLALGIALTGMVYGPVNDRLIRNELAAVKVENDALWDKCVSLQQSQVALAAHQSLTQCRCEQPGEADPELEPGKMGGRILPDTREALARALEILEKVNRIVDDIDAGRIGAHVEHNLWKGEGNVTLRRTP